MKKLQIPSISVLVKTSEKVFSTNHDEIGPNFVLNFGKYNKSTVANLFDIDISYIEWLEKQTPRNLQAIKLHESIKVIRLLQFEFYSNLYDTSRIVYNKDFKLPFGKNKGKSLKEIFDSNPGYYLWLKTSVPNRIELYETWLIVKKQIELAGKTNLNDDLIESDEIISPLGSSNDKDVSPSVFETYQYYVNGKSLEEIANIRKVKTQTIEDHIAKCIEKGMIQRNLILDNETFNYIKDIIDEKCWGNIDKLKPIKEQCDDNEIEISYAQIKYAVSDIKFKKL